MKRVLPFLLIPCLGAAVSAQALIIIVDTVETTAASFRAELADGFWGQGLPLSLDRPSEPDGEVLSPHAFPN